MACRCRSHCCAQRPTRRRRHCVPACRGLAPAGRGWGLHRPSLMTSVSASSGRPTTASRSRCHRDSSCQRRAHAGATRRSGCARWHVSQPHAQARRPATADVLLAEASHVAARDDPGSAELAVLLASAACDVKLRSGVPSGPARRRRRARAPSRGLRDCSSSVRASRAMAQPQATTKHAAVAAAAQAFDASERGRSSPNAMPRNSHMGDAR